MRPIPDALRGRAFTTADADAVGVSRRMLQGRRFTSLHRGRGVWAVADEPRDLRYMLEADRMVLPRDAVVSHVTGLRLHGIDVGSDGPRHWSTNRSVRRRLDTVVLHRRGAPLRPVLVQGIPVLPAHRCLVDAAIRLSHLDIVRAADAMTAAGLITPEGFARYAWARHLHGVRRSRANAGRIRDRVRSFRETDLRLVLAIAGLPEAQVNSDLFDELGTFLGCGDLVLNDWRIVLEYDGWYHERNAAQRHQDLTRREGLEAAGWLVIVLVSSDLDRPASLVARVWRALVSRGYRGPAPRFAPWELTELRRPPHP